MSRPEQVRQADPGEAIQERILRLAEDVVEIASAVQSARTSAQDARTSSPIALDRLDDCQQADRLGRAGQAIATVSPGQGGDHVRPGEVTQDLGQEAHRHARLGGDQGTVDGVTARPGQGKDRPHPVVTALAELEFHCAFRRPAGNRRPLVPPLQAIVPHTPSRINDKLLADSYANAHDEGTPRPTADTQSGLSRMGEWVEMKGLVRFVVMLTVISLVTSACASSAAPTWTFPASSGPAAGASSAAAMPGMSAMPPMGGMAGATGQNAVAAGATLEIHAFELGFKPAQLSVAAAGTYPVKFVNDGAVQHNITFADGTVIVAEAGATASGSVAVPAGGIKFQCTIPGHAQAGMTGAIGVGSSAAASPAPSGSTVAAANLPAPDPNATPYTVHNPIAPAVMTGTVHDIEMPIIERDMTIATGFVAHVWTFGGTVPGPAIRVHLGDTVRVHLTNTTTMSHSIDFHASQTAMNDQMVEIKPGATWTYTFRADYAGVWMYHCGTAPALEHIANGMFGMVIVEPRGGFDKVDQELTFIQNEWYYGGQGQIASYVDANSTAPAPSWVVFNGVANQYKDHPIQVQPGKRIRIFVLNVGPSEDSSFHIVGTIFDTVTKEGIQLLKGNAGGWGSQAVDLSPAQAAIIELQVPESGMYVMVTHAFNFVGHGAVGVLMAGDGKPPVH